MSRNMWPVWLVAAGLLMSQPAAVPPLQEATPPVATAETPAEVAPTAAPVFPPVWISPTPDQSGAIVVIVQPGESLWVIAARAGLSLPELLALNNLTEQSIINPGDALIVGYVTPEVAPTVEEMPPTATLPPPTPRPTEPLPQAAICLSAFEDLNRNGLQDAGEPLRAGVAFTVYNTEAVVVNYITDGRSEPKCLGGLPPGEYRVTRSVMAGETLTTAGDWSLSLAAGSELHQAFGSTSGAPPTAPAVATEAMPTAAPTPPAPPAAPSSPGNRNLIIGLMAVGVLFLGGLLLLAAVLILFSRQSRPQPATHQHDAAEGERRFRNLDDLE